MLLFVFLFWIKVCRSRKSKFQSIKKFFLRYYFNLLHFWAIKTAFLFQLHCAKFFAEQESAIEEEGKKKSSSLIKLESGDLHLVSC